ncbi:MAG: M48 family metallopeptidase [Saprospiraceae bacterium]|nr:M48 family metallopeptidase [Saprospiraceae bacterium]
MLINFFDNILHPLNPKGKKTRAIKALKKDMSITPVAVVWEVEKQKIPVDLYREPYRKGWRFAFAKNNKLLVRIPLLKNQEDEIKLLEDIQKKLAERMALKPELYEFFNKKTYQDEDILTVGTRQYTIKIMYEARKSCTGRLIVTKDKRTIDIKADAYTEPKNRQKIISTIISRIVAADALLPFSRRVDELNDKHFKKTIKTIRFKYNHSNWGSCSSSGILNFSSRLLFAPQIVQDYVIIHELAHLVELNHSDRFWSLVASAMPNYKEHEKWLKVNGAACQF